MAQIEETPEQRRLREERSRAATALYRARGLDPNRAALAGQAAGVLGLPPMVIRDSQELLDQARQQEQMQRLSEHHRSIQWIAEPGNAEIAHDQVDGLMDMESGLRRYRTPEAAAAQGQPYRTPDSLLTEADNQRANGILRRIPGGFGEGIGRSIEGLNTAGIRFLDRIGLGDTALADYYRTERDIGRRITTGAQNIGGNLSPEDQARYGRQGRAALPQTRVDTGFAGDVAGGVGQVGSSILINVATAGTGTIPSLFGQGVSSMDERVRADQRADGRTEYSASDDLALLGGGIVTGLSEKLGLDAILGRLPKPVRERLTNRLIDIFVAGAVEGTSEVVEGVGHNVLARELLGEDTGLLDGTVEGGTVGAAVGSLTRALILTAIPGRQHIMDQARADAAVVAAERFDQVAETVADNPLLSRAPEQLREFLTGASDGQTIYVPAEAAATFFQSNPDLNQWLDEWDIRDQYEAALASGSDIAIDAGTYLTKIAPSQAHEAWRTELRHGLDAMSLREAEEFQRNSETSLAESFDTAFTEAERMGNEADPQGAVFSDLTRQLREAGSTVDVANTQATVAAAYFARRAERSGGRFGDALAAYRDANLSIRSELPASLQRITRDRTDVLIEALRQARKPANQRRMFGRSLAEFISQEGGIVDTGGELAAMGADQWHRGRPGARRLIRAEDSDGKFGSDYVAQRAVEAGYLPEGATGNDLFNAMREEIAGRPTYSRDFERDPAMEENRQAVDDLEQTLARLGIDPNTATNEEIKAALDAAAVEVDGQTYSQDRLNTDTEAFQAWFGDSKVVDENGEPLVVYHGTASEFEAFSDEEGRGGFYFTAEEGIAAAFADQAPGDSDPRTVSAYLSLKNPVIINQKTAKDEEFLDEDGSVDWMSVDSYLAAAKRNGHDGAIITGLEDFVGRENGRNITRSYDQYVVFRPEQIKSVFNRGTFDPNDPRILYQGGRTLAGARTYEQGRLPEASTLATMPTPTVEQMSAMSRVESVPLEAVRGTQSKMDWQAFDEGSSPGALIDGYGDMPVAVRREDGEYLVLDGHHRTVRAVEAGDATMRMHVIDAKDYAPEVAGRRPVVDRSDTDDLLRELGLLNQGERGQIALSDTQAVITLFQSRDLSTFFHEFGHLSLDLLVRDAGLTPEAQADLDVALKYLGVESADQIGVEQHELWARSLENYLLEGKAPSLSLRSVFRTIKSWMLSIYRTARNLNAPLTDDVRSLFDRLLAGEDEIALSREALGVEAGFVDAASVGMTDQAFAAYSKQVSRAREDADAEMISRMTAAIRRKRTAEWREEADAIRPDVALEIDAQPDIRAINWMRETKTSLNREVVVRLLGDEAGLSLLPRGVPPVVTKNGVHPDSVAEAAGYSSGVELLNGLMAMEAEKQQLVAAGDKRSVRAARIDREVEAVMRERYGDPLTDGSIEAEAMAALHTERQSEVLATELSVLGRRVGQSPSPLTALRAWAADMIGGRTVREARSGKYLRAERKAANAVQKALAAKDRVEAFRQKQAQTINHLLYSEARKAEEYAEAAIRRLSRLDRARTRPSIDQDYLEQIHGLLEQFDLRQVSGRQVERRKALMQFVEEQKALDKEIYVPEALISAASKKHYSDLTVDELRALDTTVQGLAKLGRLKKQLTVKGERRSLNEIAQQAVASAEPLPTIHRADGFRKGDGWMAKLTDFGVAFEASLVKAQEWFRLLDGGDPAGIFATVLDRPANDAFVKLQELESGFFEPVIEAERAVPKAVRARWLDVVDNHPFLNPETGERLANVQRRDLIAAALQTGNLSNFEIMSKGWGLIAKDADPVAIAAARDSFVQWLDTHLDVTEWAYVQAWWNGFEGQKAEYFATARELNGYAPEPVDALPLETKAGRLSGGYVPVSYDARFDRLQQERDRTDGADIFGGLNRTSPRPDNGSTKERTGYAGPVALDLDRIAEGARKHSRYIAYGRYIENSLKFLRHPDVSRTIRDKLGPQAQQSLENWLAGQVKTDAVLDPNANAFVKAARWSRTNMTSALLLGSVNVLLAQPAGLAVSVSKLGGVGVGTARLAAGMTKTAALLASNRFGEFVFERSPIMRDRFEGAGLDRDIRLALTRNGGKRSKVEMARYLAGRMIAFIDVFVVSGPTWIAAYDRALAEGREEADAIYIADQTAEAAQGSGRASTLAGIQQSNEVTKMVTFAYGWANALYNIQRGNLADIRNGVNRMQAASQFAAVMILAPLADALISGDLPDFDDEEKDPVQAAIEWFARNIFFGAFSGVPIIRDFAGAAERKAAGKYAGPVGQTPLGRVGDEVSKLATDAWDFAAMLAGDEEAEPSRRWPAHFINSLGFVLGLPGAAQAARTTNYVTDVNDGEQNPDGLLDWIVGLTRGPQENQE